MTGKSFTVNGILLLNKPINLTSNAVLQRAKKLFQAEKAGHTGSLDPLATGMLPICLGEATKFSQYLLNADKCYQVTGLLGIKTDTADATGKIIATKEKFAVSFEQLQNTINKFIGNVLQTPSMFSALKHQGQPLYKYARAGVEIERPAREIKINSIILNSYEGNEFKLTVNCGKGTYIRNLVEDIGEKLGVYAHVLALHRVFTAGFENEIMYELPALVAKTTQERVTCLLPSERAIAFFPELSLDSKQTQALQQGKVVDFESNLSGLVRLYNADNFIGLGEISNGRIKAKRLCRV